jgi:hypothetical protein
MNQKLKNFIFNKLYEDLKSAEIIDCNLEDESSIWIVDRGEEYWYFEYEKSDSTLWWREEFFKNYKYFKVLYIEKRVYEEIITEWVEEVLGCKVINSINYDLHGSNNYWRKCVK